jgi:hypothetical protein
MVVVVVVVVVGAAVLCIRFDLEVVVALQMVAAAVAPVEPVLRDKSVDIVQVVVAVADTADSLPSVHVEQVSCLDGIVWKDLECVYCKERLGLPLFAAQ